MNRIQIFITYLCKLDISQDLKKTSDEMYDALETVDVDLDEKEIMRNEDLPRDVRVKTINLIEFYYSKADDCINKFSNKEIYDFLRELKTKAAELQPYLMNFKMKDAIS